MAAVKEKIAKALWTHAKLDVVKAPFEFQFGIINDRTVSDIQMRRLAGNMEESGIKRCDSETVIPVAIPRSKLKAEGVARCLSLTGMRLAEVPELSTFLSGPVPMLQPYSGQHRVAALKYLLARKKHELEETLVEKLAQTFSDIKKSERLANAENATAEVRRSMLNLVERDRERVAIIERSIASAKAMVADEGMWTFAIYVKGA